MKVELIITVASKKPLLSRPSIVSTPSDELKTHQPQMSNEAVGQLTHVIAAESITFASSLFTGIFDAKKLLHLRRNI